MYDGQGGTGLARLVGSDKLGKHDWVLHAQIEHSEIHPQPSPRVELFSGVPKGPRLDDMIESLSQVGVSVWAPLLTKRSVVDPRQGKLERAQRIARESIKQCLRPWPLQVRERVTFRQAIQPPTEGRCLLVAADASGDAPEEFSCEQVETIRILVGPEGGFEPAELEAIRQNGGRVLRFGPHIMRIETAAIVAGATILQRIGADERTQP